MAAYFRASMDFPGVGCVSCRDLFDTDGVLPDCIEGNCIALIDRLTDEQIRILSIRGLLRVLKDYGLGPVIADRFKLTGSDLAELAYIETELEKLRPTEGS